MNSQELAATLNNRQYRHEMTAQARSLAKECGLVVVYGASDDLMEFSGAVEDEIGCFNGGKAYFTRDGLLVNDCDNDRCPHFAKLKAAATPIEAKWDTEGYAWVYETTIPHSTFDIWEDGGKYCRGIVFSLADVPV